MGIKEKLGGCASRLRHEISMLVWRSYFRRLRKDFHRWQHRFLTSQAQVLVGAHFHRHGGVRNHMLAIQQYSKLKVLLVPEESDLLGRGVTAIGENFESFLNTPPPDSAVAVHTHVVPALINWARQNAPGRLRWIHTHHLFYYPEAGRSGLEPWQQDLNLAMIDGARQAELCLCVSRWEQQVLRSTHGVNAQYLPNGVDVVRCDRAKSERFLTKYRIPAPFVLWVGRFDPVKNPLVFVRLAESLPAFRFVMVGGVTAENLRAEYSIVVPHNLMLLPALPHADVLDAIASCAALVVTSLREGLPTLVLEAMTLRKNIVVPDEAGCLDATDDGRCAFVYHQGDQNNLTQMTVKAVESSASDRGRDRVLREYDWRVVAGMLDEIYLGKDLPAHRRKTI